MAKTTESTRTQHGRDLTVGSIPRHLFMFSLPMLIGNTIQTAYGLINMIWVGNYLGKASMAAAGITMSVIFLLIPAAVGLTMGTSILISQYAGAREWDRLKRVVQTSAVMIGIVSLLLTIIGEFTAPWILRQLDTPADVYLTTLGYLRIMLLGIPLNFGMFLAASMLRGVGDSKTPLYFQSVGLVLTAILDPILMLGLLRCPRFGLNGTAIAGTSVQTLALIAIFVYLRKKDHIVSPDWSRLGIDWPTCWMTLKIGLPAVVQQSLVSIGNIVVLRFVNGFGESTVAAYAGAGRVDALAFLPVMTFGVAVSTMAGQNIGANKLKRVKEVFFWGVILGGGITLAVSIFAIAAPEVLLRLFMKDRAVLAIGANYLRIVGISYVFFAIIFVGNGIISGAGYTLITTLVTLVSLWVVRVPLAWYLSTHMHRVEGVWWAITISSIISMIISLACYFSGFWKKPVIRHYMPVDTTTDMEAEAVEETMPFTSGQWVE